MKNRIKWLGEEIADFLTHEHSNEELVNELMRVKEQCESISQIGEGR